MAWWKVWDSNRGDGQPKTVNVVWGYFFLVNYCIGTGFLGVPYSFFYSGYLASIPTLAVTSFFAWVTARWLIEIMGRAQVQQKIFHSVIIRSFHYPANVPRPRSDICRVLVGFKYCLWAYNWKWNPLCHCWRKSCHLDSPSAPSINKQRLMLYVARQNINFFIFHFCQGPWKLAVVVTWWTPWASTSTSYTCAGWLSGYLDTIEPEKWSSMASLPGAQIRVRKKKNCLSSLLDESSCMCVCWFTLWPLVFKNTKFVGQAIEAQNMVGWSPREAICFMTYTCV